MINKLSWRLLFLSAVVLLWGCSDDEPYSPTPDENKNADLESFTVNVDSPVVFTEAGESKTIEFSILPEYLDFAYDVKSGNCAVNLSYDKGINAYNNGSYPVKIEDISPARDGSGNIIKGSYIAKLRDSGDNIFTYSEKVYLTLVYKNAKGLIMSAISNAFTVEYENDSPLLLNTGLPIVIIDIPNKAEITSKDNWASKINITIYDEDGKIDYNDSELQMKGRGNSTWGYPKKPYALKLNKKEKILGMSKHKRWCLLANYLDRTMIRNAVAFEVSRKTGLVYTPDGRFVELIVNGIHRGNYYLTEQIKVDKNRVNITDPDDEDLPKEGDYNTRGYIFELDIYFDEQYKFRSSIFDMPYMFKDPDEVWASEVSYIKQYVKMMEESIAKINTGSSDYMEYLDAESFADWWLVHEIMTNGEPNHPKSSYMYKDVDGKMFMGPVWDFDWATLVAIKTTGFEVKNSLYFNRLFQDAQFVKLVKERYAMFKSGLNEIPAYIDGLKELLRKSDSINYKMWGYTGEPNNDAADYDKAMNNLKSVYEARIKWLDTAINNM